MQSTHCDNAFHNKKAPNLRVYNNKAPNLPVNCQCHKIMSNNFQNNVNTWHTDFPRNAILTILDVYKRDAILTILDVYKS